MSSWSRASCATLSRMRWLCRTAIRPAAPSSVITSTKPSASTRSTLLSVMRKKENISQ